MGHKNNICVDCGKNVCDGYSHCKSCAHKGLHISCKIRHATSGITDDDLRKKLTNLYVMQNKTINAISKILGVTSVQYHLKRLGIKKTGKFQRVRNKPSAGWIHKNLNARWICINGREVLEHRFVMEQHLGRTLRPDELVHHINENRLDNRFANLRLMTRGEHATLHDTGKVRKGQLTEDGRKRMSMATKRRWENGEFKNR